MNPGQEKTFQQPQLALKTDLFFSIALFMFMFSSWNNAFTFISSHFGLPYHIS